MAVYFKYFFFNPNKESQKRSCVDITTPDAIFYNKFLISSSFASWAKAYKNMAGKRYRYCRRKGPFKKKLARVEKFREKILKNWKIKKDEESDFDTKVIRSVLHF